MSAWPGDGPAITDAAFEEQMAKFYDPATGGKRLTCKSREKIPADVIDGERWQDWEGATIAVVQLTPLCE